jgi:hypothetical protein
MFDYSGRLHQSEIREPSIIVMLEWVVELPEINLCHFIAVFIHPNSETQSQFLHASKITINKVTDIITSILTTIFSVSQVQHIPCTDMFVQHT